MPLKQINQTIHFDYVEEPRLCLRPRPIPYQTFGTKVPKELVDRYRAATKEFNAAETALREVIDHNLGPPFRSGGLFLGCSSG